MVDKTGTLTEGRPELTDVLTLDGVDEATVLGFAGSLERGSEHPVARSVVEGARDRGLSLAEARDVQSVPGKGLTGIVDGRRVAVGNGALLADFDVDVRALAEDADQMRANRSRGALRCRAGPAR